MAPKAQKNRAYPAFHAGLRRCEGCGKGEHKTHQMRTLLKPPLPLHVRLEQDALPCISQPLPDTLCRLESASPLLVLELVGELLLSTPPSRGRR